MPEDGAVTITLEAAAARVPTKAGCATRSLCSLRRTGADRTRRSSSRSGSFAIGEYDRTVDSPTPSPTLCERPPVQTADGVPWVSTEDLRLDSLRQGLDNYGCLFVPGLLAEAEVQRLVAGIDRTFAEFDRYSAQPLASRDADAESWYTPFEPVAPYSGRALGGRMFTRSTGGIWTVESPRMLFEVIETFERVGLGALVAAYFGERPALSAAKCNLRRTPPDIPGGWHQDGSFLGRDIATVDVWIALSTCGRDAAGLDIVPHRFEELLKPGLDEVVVPAETVLDAIASLDVEIVSPEYQPGDVLIFDHMFLHRTAVAPAMHRDRYALETWFFAPSRYPESQIPFLY